MNKVHLMGRIVNEELTLRHTASGVAVLNFTIAVRRNKETCDFIDCAAWDETAEFIKKFFSKGEPIIVHGRIECDKYEKNGETRTKMVIRISTVDFCLTSKNEKTEKPEAKPTVSGNFGFTEVNEEDAPWF